MSMFSNRRSLALLTLALVAALACGQAALALDKPEIAFTQGKPASMKGEIQGMDRDIYPFTGKAGQTLKVEVKNKVKAILFHIQLPGEEDKYLPGAGPDDDATTFQGKLPVDGVYKILVGGGGKDTKYALNVELK